MTVERQMISARGKMIAASMIGNVLEWYDFAIYGGWPKTASETSRKIAFQHRS